MDNVTSKILIQAYLEVRSLVDVLLLISVLHDDGNEILGSLFVEMMRRNNVTLVPAIVKISQTNVFVEGIHSS